MDSKARIVCHAAIFLSFACAMSQAFAFAPKIIVSFKGKPLTFDKSFQPYRSQGTVMGPFSKMGVLVGAKIARDPDGKHVSITFKNTSLDYQPGHHGYRQNGKKQNMRATSESKHGRLFVPIRLFTDVTSG